MVITTNAEKVIKWVHEQARNTHSNGKSIDQEEQQTELLDDHFGHVDGWNAWKMVDGCTLFWPWYGLAMNSLKATHFERYHWFYREVATNAMVTKSLVSQS